MPKAHLTEINCVWSLLARSLHSKPEQSEVQCSAVQALNY